ncbi:hypothetical protein [uncultured Roseibium sp.]|uniref:hypothetical protein n=1 Tax=uncultured Roseibium sp. TaxID=1936171 RepID=UPI0026038016|nr:hypothetical protein [uncultured Roseibium sp.]
MSGIVNDDSVIRRTRVSYLNQLAANHDFIWFYDGVVLHVAPIDTIKTEAIPLKNNDGRDIMRLFRQLKVLQNKFAHSIDDKNSVLVVTGPNKYVDMIKQVAASIEEGKRKKLSVLRGDAATDLPPLDPAPSNLGSAAVQFSDEIK